jgi:hypothetical protein
MEAQRFIFAKASRGASACRFQAFVPRRARFVTTRSLDSLDDFATCLALNRRKIFLIFFGARRPRAADSEKLQVHDTL